MVFTPAPHEYKSHEAREHWSEILDLAESGAVAVVRRNSAVAFVDRQVLDDALALGNPFNVQVSYANGQTSVWIEFISAHGVGSNLEQARENFLDALEEYADEWVTHLNAATNHHESGGLVRRVVLCAGDRDRMRRIVFDESTNE